MRTHRTLPRCATCHKSTRHCFFKGCTPSPSRVASVDVDASNYEFTHERRPSGYGSWAFGSQKNARTEEMFWANGMTYGDAKRAAIKWAREQGFSVIYPQT